MKKKKDEYEKKRKNMKVKAAVMKKKVKRIFIEN